MLGLAVTTRQLRLMVSIAIVLLLVGGCASTASFTATPTEDSEFYKSLAELKHNYADIEKYDRTFGWPSTAPMSSDLSVLWGEPATKKKRWGHYALGIGVGIGLTVAGHLTYPLFIATFLMFPIPDEYYTWRKGNYEIVALVRRYPYAGYEKRVHSWKWKGKMTKRPNICVRFASARPVSRPLLRSAAHAGNVSGDGR